MAGLMKVFSFDVTVSTHDDLKRGVIAKRLYGSPNNHHRIVVAAETRNAAALDASAMALQHGYLTGLYDRI